ncbi:hypothetical protein COJ46_01385 [Bacillus sp. AFS077874]|nr:hypothetical protein CON00_04140 [Bacillus sp. AFS096315]PFM83200.1 hypothetical protein COJ46_01385 [Bacillus sp. AFS077874]
MFGAIILIIIGLIFFPLGWFFWKMNVSEYDPFLALLIWIICFLMLPLGILALFNHEILNMVFDKLSHFRLLHH